MSSHCNNKNTAEMQQKLNITDYYDINITNLNNQLLIILQL